MHLSETNNFLIAIDEVSITGTYCYCFFAQAYYQHSLFSHQEVFLGAQKLFRNLI